MKEERAAVRDIAAVDVGGIPRAYARCWSNCLAYWASCGRKSRRRRSQVGSNGSAGTSPYFKTRIRQTQDEKEDVQLL